MQTGLQPKIATQTPPLKKFFGGLESLRGIAALMVVFYHVDLLYPAAWPNPLTPHLFFKNGYLMVDLFFVLSGFVICHNYSRKIGGIKDAFRFLFLRFGRLYPLHLFFLLMFLGIETAKYFAELKFGFVPHNSTAFSQNDAPSFVANLLLIHPFCSFADGTFNGPSWSIGVEFYAYLVFAIAVLVAPGKKKISIAACALTLLSAFLLIVIFRSPGLTTAAGFNFLRALMGFFLGVLAYQLYDSHHHRISRWSETISLFAVAVLILFLSFKQNPELDFVVVPLFAVLIVSVASDEAKRGVAKVLDYAPMRWLGAVSYSIYLSHLMVLMGMERILAFVQNRGGARKVRTKIGSDLPSFFWQLQPFLAFHN
jgi:peptidoglycan/LPS O-acetylase OafA/YrhL